MKTEIDLFQMTEDFFRSYWNVKNGQPPKWSDHWYFNGTIPNHDKRGCYALFKNKEIIYIGSGIGNSTDKYHGHGLGDRLKRYWQVNKDKNDHQRYTPTSEWVGLTSIRTIGFGEDYYCLAAALEIHLINKLNPHRNVNHKNKTPNIIT